MKNKLKILIPIVILISGIIWFRIQYRHPDSSLLIISGNMEVTEARLSFNIAGKLAQRFVDEGDKVTKGDLIARLDNTDQMLQVAYATSNKAFYEANLKELEAGSRVEEIRKAQARLDQARYVLAELEKGSRIQEIADSKAELERAIAIEKMQLAKLELAKSDYQRFKELYEQGVVSLRDFDHYKTQYNAETNAYTEAKARVKSAREKLSLRKEGPRKEEIERAKAALKQAEAEYELIKEGVRLETIEKAKAQVAIAEQTLKQANQQLEYTQLFAPFTGVVLNTGAEPGEYLLPGSPVVTIADLDHIWMRAYVNQKDLSKVQIGKPVDVSVDAYPGRIFNGKIVFINSEAEFTPKNVQTREERVKLMYRIKIALDNPQWELKAGMPADAVIKTDHEQ